MKNGTLLKNELEWNGIEQKLWNNFLKNSRMTKTLINLTLFEINSLETLSSKKRRQYQSFKLLMNKYSMTEISIAQRNLRKIIL